MIAFDAHVVPDDIRRLEFYDVQHDLSKYEKIFSKDENIVEDKELVGKNVNEIEINNILDDRYIEKCTNLLDMEEAANAKRLQDFDLYNVKISIDFECQTFTVVSNT